MLCPRPQNPVRAPAFANEQEKDRLSEFSQLFSPEVSLSCMQAALLDSSFDSSLDKSSYIASFCNLHNISLPDSLASAVFSRQIEYLLGRCCAREALARLGYPYQTNIPIGKDGCPIWPNGVVGSISHTGGLAVAAVIDHRWAHSIGIDIEKKVSEKDAYELLPVIASPREGEILNSSFHEDLATAFTALFSVKETIYKALYPDIRHFFDFSEVQLTCYDPDEKKMFFMLSPYLSEKAKMPRLQVALRYFDTYVISGLMLHTGG